MKKIKTILVILFFCGVSLFACSCKQRTCDVDIEKPGDLKPIDWDEYNDVYTVFWNYFTKDCRYVGFPTEKTINIYGKFDTTSIYSLPTFILTDEHKHEYNKIFYHLQKYNNSYSNPFVLVICLFSDNELQKKLDFCDLTRVFFIKGELGSYSLGGKHYEGYSDNCCFSLPCVYVYNMDDIYFEEENENNE